LERCWRDVYGPISPLKFELGYVPNEGKVSSESVKCVLIG